VLAALETRWDRPRAGRLSLYIALLVVLPLGLVWLQIRLNRLWELAPTRNSRHTNKVDAER